MKLAKGGQAAINGWCNRAFALLAALEWSARAANPPGSNPALVRACPNCGGIDPAEECAFFEAKAKDHRASCELRALLKLGGA